MLGRLGGQQPVAKTTLRLPTGSSLDDATAQAVRVFIPDPPTSGDLLAATPPP